MVPKDGRNEWYIESKGIIAVVGAKDGRADTLCASIAYAELKQAMADRFGSKAEYIPCRASVPSPASQYALDRFDVETPILYEELERSPRAKNMKVALLGHNTLRNAADGIMPAQVIEIVDRHPLGGLKTKQTVSVLVEPVGATCTIIRRLFRDCGVEPSSKVTALLCVGIVTATAGFTTKTCRNGDIIAANEMADAAGLDIDEITESLMEFRPTLQFIVREEEEIFSNTIPKKTKKRIWR
jgi:manganese-dependent inorganic pyrophosphatase